MELKVLCKIFPATLTLHDAEHSVRLYELSNLTTTINTKVVGLTEQKIKIKQNNDFVMINAFGIVLEKTILHPQGGGQPADEGHLNQLPILSVKEDKQALSKQGNATIYHFIDQACLSEVNEMLAVGQEITLTLSCDTRLAHARLHSAGHLIADIIEQAPDFLDFSAKAIAGHHFPNEAYIKVLIDCNIKHRDAFIELLNKNLSDKIKDNVPISAYFDGGIRHIKIGEVGRKCGGTHVAFTSDIQSCNIKRMKLSEPPPQSSDLFELTLFYTC